LKMKCRQYASFNLKCRILRLASIELLHASHKVPRLNTYKVVLRVKP